MYRIGQDRPKRRHIPREKMHPHLAEIVDEVGERSILGVLRQIVLLRFQRARVVRRARVHKRSERRRSGGRGDGERNPPYRNFWGQNFGNFRKNCFFFENVGFVGWIFDDF